MKTITSVAIAALMLGLAGCKPATTEKTDTPAAAAAGSVTLQPQPDLAESVEALPRLVGEGAAITAINADLAKMDAEAAAEGCEGGGGFERGVSEPMTGPGYVTFWISKGYYCEGAAHPSNDQSAITNDLSTGQRVDWVAALPGLNLTRTVIDEMPTDYVPQVQSVALSNLYSHRMLTNTTLDQAWLADCHDILTPEALQETLFKVWLDAREGGVSVAPEFAHVAQGCAESVTLTADEMKSAGVPEAIVAAVTTAHAADNWEPKDEA